MKETLKLDAAQLREKAFSNMDGDLLDALAKQVEILATANQCLLPELEALLLKRDEIKRTFAKTK